ncbi:peptidase, M23 family [Leptospira yanagawae serovar Saopaulo str. Sao Paulo = ATCC 700523]|uniref:Peptidase, M23 family n=1 Tax=Leptospira yanagawae serovar Saopaulo str. Sao Paulo = ATCC 700523 TaxID=1249483 RepID=A0A5E8HI53_9LEPT|nr:M23 family metallopeptidase [Leptospira yanagawae]EOQ90288.1 peptidase, M23 family [Leptospira yanagawae serovar Saopaulo str. Sao Paulo = ATCC 700523]
MKRIVVIFALLASFIFADGQKSEGKPEFVWPIQGLELSSLITSTFGESRKDHFHNGLDISSVLQPVRSMGDGFILYSRYAEDNPFEEERGSGNIVWVAHKNGYVSGYYHLGGTRNELVKNQTQVKAGDSLGISGNTGHSTGGHLHFVLGKDYGKTLLDPLSYLPPVEDTMPPQIANLFIHVGENYTNLNDGDNINVSKAFPLTVSIIDGGIKNSQRRGIKNVKYLFNGEVYKKANFESLQFDGSKWKTKDGLSFEDLFFKDRYLVGVLNLKAGENTIKVQTKDFSGHESERNFSINITRISGGN